MNIRSKLHTVIPYSQLGLTGKTFGMLAIHNWTIPEKDRKTEVIVEESIEGLFAKLLKNMVNKDLKKGMQNWLNLLKQECEKKMNQN